MSDVATTTNGMIQLLSVPAVAAANNDTGLDVMIDISATFYRFNIPNHIPTPFHKVPRFSCDELNL